jgi:hypothetical protein
MIDTRLSLFCVVEGEPQSRKFSVKPKLTDTIDDLKDLIKTKKANDFKDIDASNLDLWRVSIPIVPANKDNTIVLNEEDSRKYLEPAHKLFRAFETDLPDSVSEDTIHVIVQRPPPGNAHTRLLLFVTCCWNELRYSFLILSSLCRLRVGV